MADFILSCCSSADLSKERFDARGIKYLCFHFSLNGIEYPDDLGQTVPPAQLYERMLAGENSKTSQPSAGEYIDFFEQFLSEGKDVLHVTLSTGISGAYNSATVAAEQMRAKYPERKLYVVDSLGASSGYGLIMETLADLRDKGKNIDELNDWLLRHRLNMHHWFFSTDLTFYIKGGRVSRTSGFLGNMLGICPLLNMDDHGRLIPHRRKDGGKRGGRIGLRRKGVHLPVRVSGGRAARRRSRQRKIPEDERRARDLPDRRDDRQPYGSRNRFAVLLGKEENRLTHSARSA